jgi:hypothetical protein
MKHMAVILTVLFGLTGAAHAGTWAEGVDRTGFCLRLFLTDWAAHSAAGCHDHGDREFLHIGDMNNNGSAPTPAVTPPVAEPEPPAAKPPHKHHGKLNHGKPGKFGPNKHGFGKSGPGKHGPGAHR